MAGPVNSQGKLFTCRPLAEQGAERGVGRLDPEAEEGQPGLGQDRAADVERRVDDQQRGDVGQDVTDDRPGRRTGP